MSAGTQMRGARLEFVCKPLKGKHTKTVTSFNPTTKKLEHTKVESTDPAYMLYLPNGHSYRLTASEMIHRGYDRQPNIINLDKVNDTKTPAGRFKFALDDTARRKAWADLEQEVIRNCTRRHGPVHKQKEEENAAAA